MPITQSDGVFTWVEHTNTDRFFERIRQST